LSACAKNLSAGSVAKRIPDGDQELDVAARLPLLHGEMMQHAQLFGRLV